MDDVLALCPRALDRPGMIVALTGAGVSAESGIPTFRGKEGYWTIVAGTSAQTNLPWQVVTLAGHAGAHIVDVNVEANPFGDIAARSGGVIRAPAATAIPAIVERLLWTNS